MDLCRAWFRKKGGLGRCSADISSRKCSSLPATARQLSLGFGFTSTSSSSSETPTQETPPTPRAHNSTQPNKLSKKERRELLKARVEALRSRLRDSSSDDDERATPTNRTDVGKLHNKYHSELALHRDVRKRLLRRGRNPSRQTPEMRTWSLERGEAPRRGPTPPPRSPAKSGSELPPPPPVRHASRPVSFGFENGYEERIQRGGNVGQGPRSRTFYPNHPNSAPPSKTIPPAVPPRRGSLQINTSPHNLEDALQELENIYKSLKLADDSILDRADRRMLTFEMPVNQVPARGTFRSLSRSNVSGSYDSLIGGRNLSDDLAYRRFSRPSRSTTPALNPTGSYLLVSPHLSPGTSTEDLLKRPLPRRSLSREPDAIRDDVTYRAMRDANNRHPQQPEGVPFGIPTGVPISPSGTDYLRPGGLAKQRPTFQPRMTPDVIQDDMALRNLRKDFGSHQKVNTDELDAILRNGSSVKPPTSGVARRKYRAVKSLSANITHLVQKRQPGMFFDDSDRTQSMTDIMAAIASDSGFCTPPPVPPLPSRRSLKNGNSTDTLTETDHEICQWRVKHGPTSRQAARRDAGWRSDTDGRRRGTPLDERSLDELLNSLAVDTDSEVRKKVQQGKDLSPVGKHFKVAIGGEKAMGATQSCTGKQDSSSKVPPTQGDESERIRPSGGGDGPKAERIAKYKEERRRQLASKYVDWSSSEDLTSVGEEPSYTRLSNRYKKHQKSDGRVGNKNQIPDPGGTPETSAMVRSNRASRLRAMAVGASVQENGGIHEFVRVGSLRSKNSDEGFQRGAFNRRSFNGSASTPEVNGKMSSQATSSSDCADLESPRKVKDKSFKRKSNLNRSLVDAPPTASLTNDSTWRPAKKLEGPPETLSEGSNFRFADPDFDANRKRQIALKRPEIPEVLRHSRFREPDIPVDTFTVRFHVTETSRNPSNAVERVHELTQLVERTAHEMDTLTTAALNSDLVSTSDSDASHVTGNANIAAKPPSTPANYQPAQHVSRIRIKSAQVAPSDACQRMDDDKTMSESDDEAYMTPAMDCDDEGVAKKPFMGLKKGSLEDLTSILRRKPSFDDGTRTQSILKAPQKFEEPHPGILKRRSSTEGGEVRPILKKRSSVEELERLKPILKAQRATDEESEDGGGGGDDGDVRPILKKPERVEEHLMSILKNSSSEGATPPVTRRSSLVRRGSEDVEAKSDAEKGERDGLPLLPSILKKRTKDVHPLATPFTEFASIIKARTPQEETRKPSGPVELVEEAEMSGERRMSVAERIFQMETRLADDVKKSGQSTPRGMVGEVVVVTESQISSRLEQFSVLRSNRRSSPRFRTQPITMEEVVESKNVTNVEKLKQTFMSRLNGFSDTETTPKPQTSPDLRKKFLFPTTHHPQTDNPTPQPTFGHALQRSRTQPVTLNEINDFQDSDKRKEKSSSDSEEDPSKMSLAERVKLFDQKVIEEKFSALSKKNGASDARNVRRTNPRFRTQPITWAEMENAANDGEKNGVVVDGSEENCEMVAHSPPKVHAPVRVGRAVLLCSSSNDEDSSGPGYGRRVIKNEAVNRRRNAALRKRDERRSMCELDSLTEPTQQRSELVRQRSATEPITKLELERVEDDEGGESGEGKASIAERLAALRKSGEEGWKERVEVEGEGGEKVKKSLMEIRESRRDRDQRPSSIVDRISKLEIAQETWKQRVEEKDSAQFTVAGRMGCSELDISSTERVRCVPKAKIFKSETTDFKQFHQQMEKANSSSPVQRSASVPACNLLEKLVQKPGEKSENNDKVPASRVSVPKADDESFYAFFDSLSCDKRQEKVEVSEDGFKQVMSASHQMLVQRRDVVRQRRTAASSRNPVKALASRTDIQNEYVEIKTGVAEKEFKRVKTEQIAQNTSLAVSALAGLASKEDFTAISLRKGSSNVSGPLLPFKDLMLVQIKGRRHVQTRLVKPCIESMNRGDNYILVTPREVFNWIGKFSNVIEKSKATDVLNTIQTKRDLGLHSNAQVVTIDEEKHAGSSDEKRCLEILDGDGDPDPTRIADAENPREDELYESAIIDTNMAFEVEADRLVPHAKCWGTLPKVDMLDAAKVLVFDFGSEMYVWQGKLAPTPLRRAGIHLAQQLWDQGYNYSECSMNPMDARLDGGALKRGERRPEWALFGKVNQHMETVLFKEKFVDWPDAHRLIRVKSVDKEDKPEPPELVPCNTKLLLETKPSEPDLILEGSHLGRGKSYFDADSRRHYEITTLGIKVWHVREKLYKLLPRESWGQFHSGDTYVVRWQYMVTVTGRSLAGQMSRHSFVGRERCAYFFWQGADSTVNDKGASALMTVELDEERGPHVRVDEGHEQPCFLSLFDAAMVVYRGKRRLVEGEESAKGWREHAQAHLFVVRGRVESEACLVEVDLRRAALRSRGSFVLVDPRDGSVCVWHGAKALEQTRQVALCCAEIVRDRRPIEFGFECNAPIELVEMNEGSEDELFFHRLHGDGKYFTLLSSPRTFDFTPRLYHMSSISGVFVANEIHCAFRSTCLSMPFPFLQCDLYKCDQPALFLLDNEDEVYLWQGWWPEASDDNDNVATGSAKVRWNLDRRLAMESVIQYCNEKSSSPPNAYLVSAGLEPLRFTNIFPKWEVREDVTALNSQDGKRPNDCPLVSDILPIISRSRYTLAELQSPPLPEGVDPSRIESYLNDSDFEEALGMPPTEFYVLPAWKQNEMKKLVSLF